MSKKPTGFDPGLLLAIDIGNTTVTCAVFRDNSILSRLSCASGAFPSAKSCEELRHARIGSAIISSVVPKAIRPWARLLRNRIGVRHVMVLGRDCRVPVKNRYRYPEQVGQDRLVNAYAGIRLYGAPLVIVDFGTAVTFDVVSRKKEYLGGMIIPGLRISLKSLWENTALLPRATLREPKEFIGRDTESSMISGIVYGYSALSDELCSRIRQEIGRKAKIIGTGGNARLLSGYCRKFNAVDPDLTLKGLYLIYLELVAKKGRAG